MPSFPCQKFPGTKFDSPTPNFFAQIHFWQCKQFWGLFLLQKSEKDVNRATFEREGRVIVAEKVDIESIPGWFCKSLNGFCKKWNGKQSPFWTSRSWVRGLKPVPIVLSQEQFRPSSLRCKVTNIGESIAQSVSQRSPRNVGGQRKWCFGLSYWGGFGRRSTTKSRRICRLFAYSFSSCDSTVSTSSFTS